MLSMVMPPPDEALLRAVEMGGSQWILEMSKAAPKFMLQICFSGLPRTHVEVRWIELTAAVLLTDWDLPQERRPPTPPPPIFRSIHPRDAYREADVIIEPVNLRGPTIDSTAHRTCALGVPTGSIVAAPFRDNAHMIQRNPNLRVINLPPGVSQSDVFWHLFNVSCDGGMRSEPHAGNNNPMSLFVSPIPHPLGAEETSVVLPGGESTTTLKHLDLRLCLILRDVQRITMQFVQSATSSPLTFQRPLMALLRSYAEACRAATGLLQYVDREEVEAACRNAAAQMAADTSLKQWALTGFCSEARTALEKWLETAHGCNGHHDPRIESVVPRITGLDIDILSVMLQCTLVLRYATYRNAPAKQRAQGIMDTQLGPDLATLAGEHKRFAAATSSRQEMQFADLVSSSIPVTMELFSAAAQARPPRTPAHTSHLCAAAVRGSGWQRAPQSSSPTANNGSCARPRTPTIFHLVALSITASRTSRATTRSPTTSKSCTPRSRPNPSRDSDSSRCRCGSAGTATSGALATWSR